MIAARPLQNSLVKYATPGHHGRCSRHAFCKRMLRNWLSGVQVIEQRLGVESIEAFGGRAVRELAAEVFAPEPRHAHRGAEFPEWLVEREQPQARC